jgi:flagellar hook-associated protein 3 FlgL
MRVTTKMLTSSLLNNINNNLSKLQEYENQLSSNVKVDKASDDPVAAAKILKAKSALKSQDQYSTNMEYASGLLETVDGALASVDDVLLRAREITVSGSTGTTTTDSMKALADEVDGMIGEMVQVANTDYNGSYVFAGGETSKPPFTTTPVDGTNVTGVNFITSDPDSLDETYSQKVEIAAGVTVDISAGRTTFHTGTDGKDDINSVFKTLINLRDSLATGDQTAVSACLSDIDAQTDHVINERAVVGAKSNRIELAQSRAETYNASLTTLISNLGDADYAEASASYSVQQAVYSASLSVGAKIIQPSLLDFLK